MDVDDSLLTDDELMQITMAAVRRENSAPAGSLQRWAIERAIAQAQRDKLVRLGWEPRINERFTP